MLEVKVTITLAPEILTILQGLIGHAPKATVNGAAVAKAAIKEQPSEETEETVRLDELTEVAKTLLTTGKRDELKKILSNYGTDRISNLEKRHYAEAYKKLKDLISTKEAA